MSSEALCRVRRVQPKAGLDGETPVCDLVNERLEPLKSFILPGGSELAARLHLARTVCRRAERLAVELAEAASVNPVAVAYLNRLSDLLFILSRVANPDGDVLWQPGGPNTP